jgi:hypothetical protein
LKHESVTRKKEEIKKRGKVTAGAKMEGNEEEKC